MRKYCKPWVFGLVAGVLFVGIEALFRFYPPQAYVFCLTCHTRDFINRILNTAAGSSFMVSGIGAKVFTFTSPAVIAGAFFAAVIKKERKILKAQKPWLFFFIGFCIMIIGILIFGCPTRLLLRAGYGDVYAIAAVAAMFAGIWTGTVIQRKRA